MTVAPPSRSGVWPRENAYTALWSVEPRDDLFREIERQFSSWIRDRPQTRDWDPALADGVSTGPNDERLLVVHRDSSQGKTLRLKLAETNTAGNWRTSLTAHLSAHGDSWIVVHTGSDGFTRAKPPRLARLLLESIEVRDGETWLSDKPQKIYTSTAGKLADEVTHIERQIPYLVVGTSGELPFDTLVDRVATWTKDTVGLAQVAVLDPAATAEFNNIVGSDHAVPTETIRTYVAGADPAISIDARRHRILSTSRLAGSDAAVRNLLGDIALRHASRRIFPSGVRSELRAMARTEDKFLLDSVFAQMEASADSSTVVDAAAERIVRPHSDSYEATSTGAASRADLRARSAATDKLEHQLEIVRTILNISEISETALLSATKAIRASAGSALRAQVDIQLEVKERQIERLQEKLEESQLAYEQMDFDLALANSESDKATRESQWLRSELRKHGDPTAYALAPTDESDKRPESIPDLCDTLDAFGARGVVFTGSVDEVIALETHDDFGRIAGCASDCLTTLADYVAARSAGDFDRGLFDYLKNPPDGYRTVAVTMFAATESETVQNDKKMLRERIFAVPGTVDKSGSMAMLAHFKIASVATISPRLHLYDNWTSDGRVYVGYIGRHLTNTKTN